MLIDSLVAAMICAKIRGGKFTALLNVELRYVWLIALAFIVEYGSMQMFPGILFWAILFAYGLLVLFSYFNRSQPGFQLIILGIVLNATVMLANHGRMPVSLAAARDLSPVDVPALVAGEYGKHIAISAYTHLNFLGDIIYIPKPYPYPTIISAGDIIFCLGLFIFIQRVMVAKSPVKELVSYDSR